MPSTRSASATRSPSVIGVQGAPPDTTPPTLAAADIVDDRAGEPVIQNTPVSYSVTFSEEMNPATVNAADFGNAGTASITINSIIHPLPGVFVVQVTPTTPGSLQLQVNAGAVLTDSAGNPLDTAAAISDDTGITVNPLIVPVPDVTGMPQASAESSIAAAELAVGTVTSQYHAAIACRKRHRSEPARPAPTFLSEPLWTWWFPSARFQTTKHGRDNFRGPILPTVPPISMAMA